MEKDHRINVLENDLSRLKQHNADLEAKLADALRKVNTIPDLEQRLRQSLGETERLSNSLKDMNNSLSEGNLRLLEEQKRSALIPELESRIAMLQQENLRLQNALDRLVSYIKLTNFMIGLFL